MKKIKKGNEETRPRSRVASRHVTSLSFQYNYSGISSKPMVISCLLCTGS